MIDLHNHILPGIDDGARDMDEALTLLRHFAEEGYHTLALTPHVRPGLFPNSENDLRIRFAALKNKARGAGIALDLRLSAEYYYDSELVGRMLIPKRDLLSFDGHEKYVLLEFDGLSAPLGLKEVVFELKLAGMTPVMAHPERYAFLGKNLSFVEKMVDAGMLMQGTLRPLSGFWGYRARRTLKRLLDARLIHLISSDIHRASEAREVLSEGRRLLEGWVGKPRCEILLEENPRRLLNGEPVESVG